MNNSTGMNRETRYYEKTFLNENAIGAYSERKNKLVAEFLGCTKGDDGVATVSVYGGLYPIDYDWLTSCLEGLKADDAVEKVVMHINSPGGAVAGLFDCCDYIKSFGKPITAYISGMACSAAYAIATACDKVYSQQDAETGCCGCYAHLVETSDDALKAWGFLTRVFRSKNAPRKNLSIVTNEEEAKAFQAEVDALGDKYLAYVAANRGVDVETAEKTFGQGASVTAEHAVEAGMIDGVCSIEQIPGASVTDEETTSSSLNEEGEGEDMDINSMSAEEQAALFAQLCEANPSLLEERVEEARRAEDERVSALDALRNGSEAVDAVVDAAVADGRCAADIALDVVKVMKDNPAPVSGEARTSAVKALADDTVDVGVPMSSSAVNEFVKAAEELNGKEE